MPIIARIQGITQEAAGWPETMAMATMAVAGAQLDAGTGLQLDSQRTESTSRSYGALGARPGSRMRRWPSIMTTATFTAAAIFGRGGQGARGGIRRQGERGWEQDLTGRRHSRSVGSGTSLTARIDGEGLGCPRLKMTAMTMKQGLPASHSSIGRTRRFLRCFWTRRKGEGARWSRQRRSAVSGVLGGARKRGRRKGARQRKEGKVRGGRPHRVGVEVDSGEASQREAGGGRKRTHARHASPLPTGRRKKTALPSVGWAAIVPTQVGR